MTIAREGLGKAAEPRDARATATLTAPEQNAEALLRSTLDALSAHIAVLDETGTIIAVNQAWRDFAGAAGYEGENDCLGTSYLAVCEHGAAESQEASSTARALRDIMAGRRASFRMEYPCATPFGPRWFQVRITRPPVTGSRRIVVAHEDITDVKQAEEALALLNARLLRLQDEERRHIARELHDTTAQNLLAITLKATRLHDRHQSPDRGHEAMAEILDLAEQSLQEVRTLCYLVHPPLLDDVGLEAALRWLTKGFGERSGIAAETRADCLGVPLTQDAATALYRVAQEALLNVHRHSGSTWARVTLRCRDQRVELDVEDAGRGLPKGARDEEDGAPLLGVGMSGMRVRLEQLGGRLEVHPRRPGLLVRGILPLDRNSEGAE